MPTRMDLITKLHQPFVVNKLMETDWAKGTNSPLVVELDTTEACDLACPNCISEDIVNGGNKFSDERLMALGREFVEQGVKGVILIGGGEPLAHPVVGEFMTYLGKNDIHIGITTNGTLIGRYLDEIAQYSSWTRVSVDAATQATFDRLRPSKGGKSKFSIVIDGMRALAEKKCGKLGFSFLIQTPKDGIGEFSNVGEIYQAAELARDIGCDYFEVKPTYQYRGGVDHALVVHDDAYMKEARRQVEALGQLETDDFKIIKAINLDVSLSMDQCYQPKDYHWCPVSELRTLITPSGVYVCPYWRGKEHMKLGDVRGCGFAELWLGDQRQSVMRRVDPAKDCMFHCLRHESNLEVIKMIEEIKSGSVPRVVEEFDRFI